MEDIKELKDNQLEKSSGGTALSDYIGKTVYRGDVFTDVANRFGYIVSTTVDITSYNTPVTYYIIARDFNLDEWFIYGSSSTTGAVGLFNDNSMRFSQSLTNKLGYLLAGK